MAKIIKKVVQVGKSEGVILPRTELKKIKAKIGDYVEISFNKVS